MTGRTMALTEELLARCHREVVDPEPDPDALHLDDADYAAMVDEALAVHPNGGPLWLFAYGSLIWKPEIEHGEERGRWRVAGSAADYLYDVVKNLEERGIHDLHLWRLQRLVAARESQRGSDAFWRCGVGIWFADEGFCFYSRDRRRFRLESRGNAVRVFLPEAAAAPATVCG